MDMSDPPVRVLDMFDLRGHALEPKAIVSSAPQGRRRRFETSRHLSRKPVATLTIGGSLYQLVWATLRSQVCDESLASIGPDGAVRSRQVMRNRLPRGIERRPESRSCRRMVGC
ncbi:MAG: hypothetical protein ACTS7I_01250 [Candidatus Hodgkinia cicadicola]